MPSGGSTPEETQLADAAQAPACSTDTPPRPEDGDIAAEPALSLPPDAPPSATTPADAEDDDSLGVLPGARVCGNCRLFKPVLQDAGTWRGDCRVTSSRRMFPASAPICGSFLARAAPVPRALNPVSRPDDRRARPAPVVRPSRTIDHELPELADMTREELKDIIREALTETDVRLAPRWEGGKVLLKPADEALQAKELPIDSLFHKVVMVRDRLRVLEQRVNAHPKLSDAEKVELQQYVTRCYGSLTTFNILFADKDDQFTGDKGKGE